MSCMELRLPPGGRGFSPYEPLTVYLDVPNIGLLFMTQDCMDWLMDHFVQDIVQTSWDVANREWIITLPEDLALLFKLTWGGR